MNREVVDKWCERGILYLVLAIMVFGPLATGAVRSLEFLTIQGLTMGVMALWGVRLWANPKPQMLWTPLCWAIVVFELYAVARYFTADVEYIARGEMIHILVYGFLFFAILNNLHRQESIQIICFSMIGLAVAISGYAVYQYVTGSDKVWNCCHEIEIRIANTGTDNVWYFIQPPEYKGRAGGTYINPNNLAGFLEMLLPLAVAYTLAGRLKPVTRVLLGYAACVMAVGMAVTVSRGGWTSCGIGLVALMAAMLLHRNFRLQAALFLALLLVACGVFFFMARPFQSRFRAESGASDTLQINSDLKKRLELWDAAVRMWRDNPWFGVGPGLYDYRFPAYRPPGMQMRPERAHNEYLNTLADWGVVGEGIVMGALAMLGWGFARTWKNVRRSEKELGSSYSSKFAFVLGAAAGLLAILIHSFVDFNLQVPANAILATCLMALLTSHLRFTSDRYWKKLPAPGRTLWSAVLVVGLAFLGWQENRLGREYYWTTKAFYLPVYSSEQAAALEKACSAEPQDFENTYRIGEAYRVESWDGGDDYVELANKAMPWYSRGMKLDPYDSYNYLRYGMCLDWVNRQGESGPYFSQADELDPNSSYTASIVGWHYVQTGDYAAAKIWLMRSQLLLLTDNYIAPAYLPVVQDRLMRTASNTNGFSLP